MASLVTHHPLRLGILLALEDETLSPNELAQRLHVGLRPLAYPVLLE